MNNALFPRLNPIGAVLITVGALTLPAPAMAVSGFTGVFDPGNFTLSNTNANGTITTTNSAPPLGEVVLTGGNNGSLSSGSTTWISTAPITPETIVSFSWSFAGDGFPFDPGPPGDGDRAGYVINGAPTFLATIDGDFGNIASLTIPAGQTFGFIVETADNSGTAGVFTVTSFNATPVPLETDALPILFSAAFMGGGVWLKRRSKGIKG